MSEPKPVWNPVADTNAELYDSLSGPLYNPGWKTLAIPHEAIEPFIESINEAQRMMLQKGLEQALSNMGMAMAELAASSLFATRTVTELFEVAEQLRMKMIGRRYQWITAVLVVLVVYLMVEFLTR